MTDRVWETGFEQLGNREIDRDATPWRVIDTYRVWLTYKGRVYHERVLWEHDWAGPQDAPTPGESAPATDPQDLYDLVRSAIANLKDRATTFRVPGEEVPPFDGEDPPPYRPSPKPDEDQYHVEGDCWCGETHQKGVCPGCGKQLGPSEWHYHGH